nr:protein DMR6-LIKE OXYGENASE 2-like isoform X1 [Ipomoea trifida]
MATPAMLPFQNSANVAPISHHSSSATVKVLSESPDLNSIPFNYVHSSSYEESPDSSDADEDYSSLIPVIDFSHLTSNHNDQKSKAIQALGKACEEWGFFMVVNHGIPESLIKAVIDVTNEFFNMGEEDKKQFEGKDVLDTIRCGTSFNSSKEKAFFWRDFLKVFVHPQFHCPSHPQAFSEVMSEYCENSRNVAKKILGAISESLGLEECAINNALALDSMFQIFIGNYYPRCPQPELAMGLPPHSDHGLLTLLIQNGVGGLQIMHEQKWVDVNALPNSLLVNTGDHLEIFSNGKYKSVVHRAVVNNKEKRISIATAHGPSPETVVRPASQLMEGASCQPAVAYRPMKYMDYIHMQQSNQLHGKSCLDHIASLRGRSKPAVKISGSFVQMGRKKKNKRLFILAGSLVQILVFVKFLPFLFGVVWLIKWVRLDSDLDPFA